MISVRFAIKLWIKLNTIFGLFSFGLPLIQHGLGIGQTAIGHGVEDLIRLKRRDRPGAFTASMDRR
jgi:hypothetical protein